MRPPFPAHANVRRLIWLSAIVLIVVTGWAFWQLTGSRSVASQPASAASAAQPAGPPWRYGRADARFTLIGYADLECRYCQAYFPVLQPWIDENPEVNWQWHHLPLSMHEPMAARAARLAECAGEAGGHAAFWDAVSWIYRHTRGDGQGVPADSAYPALTPAVQACLDSDRPQAIVRAQAEAAAREGIAATPTLRLRDHESGRELLLHGPVAGDALLSALDLLAAPHGETTEDDEMPADVVSDMPR